jgi:hypothetical protein
MSDLPQPAARRLRLFGVACARQVRHLFADGDHAALQVSERYADGLASQAELKAMSRPLSNGPLGVSTLVSDSISRPRDAPREHWRPRRAGQTRSPLPEPGRPSSSETSHRPTVPSWLTSDALALARGIYAEEAFDRMPILAGALQDAGCDNDEILNHCRGPGPHVRGCWVVDLLLGKE